MQILIKKAGLIVVWLFIFAICHVVAVAQPSSAGLSMSLSLSDRIFDKSTKPNAYVTIENKTGSSVRIRDFDWFALHLQLNSRPRKSCRIDECFSATLRMPKQEIENGKSITYRVKLESLHWHNLISSNINLAYPRNLFTEIPSGEYSLTAKLSARSPDWKPEDQTYIAFESNSITAEVRTKRK